MDTYDFTKNKLTVIPREDWREMTSLLNDSEIAFTKKRREKFAHAAYTTDAALDIIDVWKQRTGKTLTLKELRYLTGHTTFEMDTDNYSTVIEDKAGDRHLFINVYPQVQEVKDWVDADEPTLSEELLDDTAGEEPLVSSDEAYEEELYSGAGASAVAAYPEENQMTTLEQQPVQETVARDGEDNTVEPVQEYQEYDTAAENEQTVKADSDFSEDNPYNDATQSVVDDEGADDREETYQEPAPTQPVQTLQGLEDTEESAPVETDARKTTPAKVLTKIFQESNAARTDETAGWEFPPDMLEELLTLKDEKLTREIAASPTSPVEVLNKINLQECPAATVLLAGNPASNDETFFRVMENDPDLETCKAIAENPSASLDVLDWLADVALHHRYESILQVIVRRLLAMVRNHHNTTAEIE